MSSSSQQMTKNDHEESHELLCTITPMFDEPRAEYLGCFFVVYLYYRGEGWRIGCLVPSHEAMGNVFFPEQYIFHDLR